MAHLRFEEAHGSEPYAGTPPPTAPPAAVHEFPQDWEAEYTTSQTLYMFLALAIICDDYFVTSLEKICVFITHGDVGVGTIVGSAVFNILCIIGVCGIFAGQVFNSSMQKFFTGKPLKNVANGNAAASSELEDVKPAKAFSRGSVVMVDEIINASPPKYRFPEAGLRIMVTSHFGPKTRLRMASRLIITERQKLVQAANGVETQVIDGKVDIENGNVVPEDKPSEEKENETISPFHIPAGIGSKVKWLISWPLLLILFFTIPNCAKPRWEKFFMLSFILSTVWIAVFSYLMVWMVTIIGFTLGIPDVIMGITFLAAGTSVPDCIASLIVARQGLVDMGQGPTTSAASVDIPWGGGLGHALGPASTRGDYGSEVMINSRGLVYSVVLLLGSVALTVLGIHLNRWRLTPRLGVYVLVLYAIFLCFSIMIEYNVFTFVNLPMCME
ncbi:hypothetical protein CRUP_011834 [Coryphaenoides rupestris]|nr:hypothetical protein CRUP_011834 [Coryphaenoides rupestris]